MAFDAEEHKKITIIIEGVNLREEIEVPKAMFIELTAIPPDDEREYPFDSIKSFQDVIKRTRLSLTFLPMPDPENNDTAYTYRQHNKGLTSSSKDARLEHMPQG